MNKSNETVMTFEPREGLWTVKHVAEFLKASRSWVYQKAEGGELPCLRIGGLLRFDPEAIRAFVRGDRVGAQVLHLPMGGKPHDATR